MTMRDEFEKTGSWLFKWRSYLPLLMIIVILGGIKNYQYPGPKLDLFWELLCLSISFFGLGIRAFTVGYTPKGTSGRNTNRQIADVLNTRGMYSIVRHPLYLGNFLIWFGISLFVRLWWISTIFTLIFWLYYERIMFAEEEFLRSKFDNTYLEWAEKTPAIWPKFKNWQPPDLPFSMRNILKREYSGFFGIIASFTFLEIMSDVVVKGKFELDLLWTVFFIVGLLIYTTLIILKKKTNLLNVKGR